MLERHIDPDDDEFMECPICLIELGWNDGHERYECLECEGYFYTPYRADDGEDLGCAYDY